MANIIDLSALKARDRIELEDETPREGEILSAKQALARPNAPLEENHFSGSADTGSTAGTELDVAAAVVFLKARARQLGRDAVPMEVWMQPLNPQAGWVLAAQRFVAENAKRRQRGEFCDLR